MRSRQLVRAILFVGAAAILLAAHADASPQQQQHSRPFNGAGEGGSQYRRLLRGAASANSAASAQGAASTLGSQAAACLPLSQEVTTEALLDAPAPAAAAASASNASNASAPALRGTVNISNRGGSFLALDFVTVRVCSKVTEHLRVMAKCPQEGPTVAPFGALTCSWEAPLPAGKSADMYNGLISSATLALTGDCCNTPCISLGAGGEGVC